MYPQYAASSITCQQGDAFSMRPNSVWNTGGRPRTLVPQGFGVKRGPSRTRCGIWFRRCVTTARLRSQDRLNHHWLDGAYRHPGSGARKCEFGDAVRTEGVIKCRDSHRDPNPTLEHPSTRSRWLSAPTGNAALKLTPGTRIQVARCITRCSDLPVGRDSSAGYIRGSPATTLAREISSGV